MSDKARPLYPVAITINSGDIPSHTKFTALSSQAKNGLKTAEFLIGDPWNQSGDPILSPSGSPTLNALHQTNLARSIGKMANLNPLLLGDNSSPGVGLLSPFTYTDSIGLRAEGKNIISVIIPPNVTPTAINTTIAGDGGIFTNFVSSPTSIVPGSGDWTFTIDGVFHSGRAIPLNTTITYEASPSGNIKGANTAGTAMVDIGSGWNVIPDPRGQGTGYDGCKISFVNGANNSAGYHIWLPPRKPLYGSSKSVTRTPNPISSNISTTPEVTPLKYYQSLTANASLLYGNHYRYTLPQMFHGLAAGSAIPEGIMYIWDEERGTIVQGISLAICSNSSHAKFKIVATGTAANSLFGNAIGNGIVTSDATQIPADYISRFRVIIASVSVADSLLSLWADYLKHSHDSANSITAQVNHKDLHGNVTPPYSATINPLYGIYTPTFVASKWTDDYHPQYLHRAGSYDSALNGGQPRDPWDNAVFFKFAVVNPYGASNINTAKGMAITTTIADASLLATSPSCPVIFGNNNGTGTPKAYMYIWPGGYSDPNTHLDLVSAGYMLINSPGPVHVDNLQIQNVATGESKIRFKPTAGGEGTLSNNYIQFFDGGGSGDKYQFYIGGTNQLEVALGSAKADSYDYALNVANGKTQYKTITGLEFVPENHNTDNISYVVPYGYVQANAAVILTAPLHLPNGAIILSTDVITVHSIGTGSLGFNVDLYRRAKTSFTITDNPATIVTPSTYATMQTSTASPVGNITINNSPTGSVYTLIADMPAPAATSARLYSVTVTYHLPSVNN